MAPTVSLLHSTLPLPLRLLLLQLLLLVAIISPAEATRVVTFHYVPDSASCGSSEIFDFDLLDFNVDCGNANHGCTPGGTILLWGQFNASTYFNPIADVRVEACEFFGLMCTEVLYQEDYNLCTGLNLEDPYGYQACEREELYSFEVSYMLPNHTWWEDLAVNGFTFQAYVTLDSSLYCHATFETQVYYDTGAWVKMAVGSVMIAAAVAVYYKKKMPRGVIDLCAAEQQMKDDTDYTVEVVEAKQNINNNSTKSMIISKNNSNKQQLVEDASSIIQNNIKNSNNNNQQHPKVQYVQQEEYGDDESVTTTSYMRMLDFSPSGLSHADRMEQVRQAHFERLRMTRESRRARLSNHNNTATSRGR